MYEYEYRPFVVIILVELILFAYIWFAMLVKRYSNLFISKHRAKISKQIGTSLNAFFIDKEPDMEVFGKSKRILLKKIEEFNQLYGDEKWDAIRLHLVRKYLIKTAEKYSKSLLWRRRLFAARTFYIFGCKDYEAQMLRLLKSSHALIQTYAGRGLIEMKSHEGIKRVLALMKVTRGYRYYLFRDFFHKSSIDAIKILIEIGTEPDYRHICLTVLAPLVVSYQIPYLEEAIHAENKEDKLFALELASNNPIKNTEDILLGYTDDPDEDIQLKAIRGLVNIASDKSIDKFKEIFTQNRSTRVTIEVVRALNFLNRINELERTEIVEYVENFG